MRITARAIAASIYLKDKGFETSIFGINEDILKIYGVTSLSTKSFASSDIIIFPLPFSTDGEHINCPFSSERYGVSDVFRKLDKNALIFSGMASSFHKKIAEEYGLRMHDYYECEDLQIKNAVPTAEGAIRTFMEHKKITVFGSHCVVTGFGKVGMCLADRLKNLGSNVTVAARSPKDLSLAETMGHDARNIDFIISNGTDADCIFNTIPCNIFNSEFIDKISDKTLYLELASKPWGMNKKCAEGLGERYVAAPSLPGKYTPETAGIIIAETVCKFI